MQRLDARSRQQCEVATRISPGVRRWFSEDSHTEIHGEAATAAGAHSNSRGIPDRKNRCERMNTLDRTSSAAMRRVSLEGALARPCTFSVTAENPCNLI